MYDLIKTLFIITQLLLAVAFDLYCYKVKNQICFTFAIVGLIYNLLSYSQASIYQSILGLSLPLLILLPLYMLNMLGAGDIKLFCSLGALIGINNILVSIAFSFMFGFVLALCIMVVRRNLRIRLNKLFIYFKSCFLYMSILPYEQPDEKNDGRMHFTKPIALGVITVCFM